VENDTLSYIINQGRQCSNIRTESKNSKLRK